MCFDATAAGAPAVVMVDSGASTTPEGGTPSGHAGYVSAAWVYAQGLLPLPAGITKVRTADDQDAQLLGHVRVHVQIGAYTDWLSMLVMARQLEVVDMILATDWM